MKTYNEAAEHAVQHNLPPASNDDTCNHWRELGVTRQTGYNWRRDGAPLTARLAVAWMTRAQ